MDDVRGVAEEGQARGREAAGDAEGQGEAPAARLEHDARRAGARSGARSRRAASSGSSAKRCGTLSLASVQTIEERWPSGPPGGSGRMANGPDGRKCSTARPSWSRSCADRRDDAGLRVGPADPADAGLLAQARARAVGGDEQRRLDHLAVGERDGDRTRRRRRSRATPIGRRSHAPRAARGRQGGHERAALDHVGEGLAGLDLAAEGEEDRTHRVAEPAVGDDHVEDRLRAFRDLRPDAERRQHASRARRRWRRRAGRPRDRARGPGRRP